MSSHHASIELATSQTKPSIWKDRIMPALLCIGLGLTLLYGSAFAESSKLHNAAHDARHAASFPCH